MKYPGASLINISHHVTLGLYPCFDEVIEFLLNQIMNRQFQCKLCSFWMWTDARRVGLELSSSAAAASQRGKNLISFLT